MDIILAHPWPSPEPGMLMYITILMTQRMERRRDVLRRQIAVAPSTRAIPRHFVGLRPTIGWRENIDTS